MSFSSDGNYLASSGKDRRLCLWKNTPNGYILTKVIESAHKRIIWSVDFFSSKYLASGARDGFVKLWNIVSNDGVTDLVKVCQFEPAFQRKKNEQNKKVEPVTAVAYAPMAVNNKMILAIGMECGRIEIWAIDSQQPNSYYPLIEFPHSSCHVSSVKKLVWKPIINEGENKEEMHKFTLASCGLDHGVRIFNINII